MDNEEMRALFLPPTNEAYDKLAERESIKVKVGRDLVYVPRPLGQQSKVKGAMKKKKYSNEEGVESNSVFTWRSHEMKKEKSIEKRQRNNKKKLEEQKQRSWVAEAIESSLESKFSKLCAQVKAIVSNTGKNAGDKTVTLLNRLTEVNDQIIALADNGHTPRPLSKRSLDAQYPLSTRSATTRPTGSLYPLRPLAPRPSTQLLSRRGIGGLGVGPVSLTYIPSPISPRNVTEASKVSLKSVDITALTNSRVCIANREVKLAGFRKEGKMRPRVHMKDVIIPDGYDDGSTIGDMESRQPSCDDVHASTSTEVCLESNDENVDNPTSPRIIEPTESMIAVEDLDGDIDNERFISRIRLNYATVYVAQTLASAEQREAKTFTVESQD